MRRGRSSEEGNFDSKKTKNVCAIMPQSNKNRLAMLEASGAKVKPIAAACDVVL